jgi:hypothetical protein
MTEAEMARIVRIEPKFFMMMKIERVGSVKLIEVYE